MSSSTASLPAITEVWTPWYFELLKHEYGVTCFDWEPPEDHSDAEQLRQWVAERRGSGRGPVVALHELVRKAAWEWFGADKPSALRAVRALVIARLCWALNEEDSGLEVVPLPSRKNARR